MNVVVLSGALSAPPQARQLPSGDHLVSYEVTIRDEHQPTESVRVVWFDPPARAKQLGAGAEVVVSGRVRRRFFRTGGGTASSTEVVAHQVVPASQRVRVLGMLDAAIACLDLS